MKFADSLEMEGSSPLVLAVGNTGDGITLIGPFDESEDATDYAEMHLRNEDWVIMELWTVKEEAKRLGK